MSHFVVLVLSPESPEDPEAYVEGILAPYDEALNVEPYLADCYCLGNEAEDEVNAQAEKELGRMADIRDKYWQEVETGVQAKVGGLPYSEANSELHFQARKEVSEAICPTWEARIEPYLSRKKELLELHPKKGAADPECEECNGSGKYSTTYNPRSKWDWWTIGGRWTGYLRPEYDPTKDPRNLATCWLCQGTGKRNDELGRKQRETDPTYTCNGCSGSGKEVVFPSKYASPPEGGNVAPVSHVIKLLEAGEDVLPFALVRPSGEWLEKGKMGWWAIVSDEKENWKQASRAILEEYSDHWAIVVDCHI